MLEASAEMASGVPSAQGDRITNFLKTSTTNYLDDAFTVTPREQTTYIPNRLQDDHLREARSGTLAMQMMMVSLAQKAHCHWGYPACGVTPR